MLARVASCAAARRAAAATTRSFSACPVAATSKLYEDFVGKSVKAYQASQKEVDGSLDADLKSNKMVLFMEGTPDAPKSEASLNAIRILTQVQAASFLSVDVLAHPAILGYTVTKSQRNRGPHLYVNGSFFADHDGLLAKFSTGDLAKEIGTEGTKS